MYDGPPKLSRLIQGLQIFLKYGDADWPTHCEHDELWICNVNQEGITEHDKELLDHLGFFYDEDDDSYKSFTYGSA